VSAGRHTVAHDENGVELHTQRRGAALLSPSVSEPDTTLIRPVSLPSRMTVSRVVELEGHIIDSGLMERAFSTVMEMGGSFEVETFRVGTRKDEESYARMVVSADTENDLQAIVHELHQNGATLTDPADATLEPAPEDGVVPPEFYSTTNHPTDIRYDDEWLPVEGIEMDAAVVVDPAEDGRETSR
jgi:Uncharacterized conserved protein